MENLPLYIPIVFLLTTLLGISIFYKATHSSKPFLVIVLCWIAFQSVLSLSGFYQHFTATPPRFPLVVLPPFVFIAVLFLTTKGKVFIESLDLRAITLFSIIRIPVEIVLFWLFVHKAVPELMTFEGRNLDILSGLSAPVVYYFVFVKKKGNRTVLLVWNFVCLALLTNVVVNALLSIPSKFQQFAFEQPNVAVAYFPFVLLPACLVPLVFFSHFASIRQLINGRPNAF